MAATDLRRHLLFDLSQAFHLPTYLRYLLEYAGRDELPGDLFLAVRPSLPRSHPDLVALAGAVRGRNVHFLTPTPAEWERKAALEAALPAGAVSLADFLCEGRAPRDHACYEWELLARLAGTADATHCTLLWGDHYLPLLVGGAGTPGPLSVIHFGPRFHYDEFTGTPTPDARAAGEKLVLVRALRNPGLRTLYFLDPFAAARAAAFPGGGKVRFLPDPVRLAPADPAREEALGRQLGIEPGRRVFLLFGHLGPRKCALELIEAVELLPAALARRLCLLVVGRGNWGYLAAVAARAAAARQRTPAQIVTHFHHVPHEDIPVYFRRADVVLAAYAGHAGMSGVVLTAAAAGRPVLVSSDGLLGELTRRRRLGLTADAPDPAALAAGLRRFLEDSPEDLYDPAELGRLAREHEADHFAAALLNPSETGGDHG